MILLLLAACDTPITSAGAEVDGPRALAPLSPTVAGVGWEGDAPYLTSLAAPRLLRRMSLDLRGVLPTEAELDAVEADPTLLDGYRDTYLADPRLEDRLVSLFAERWHTVMDEYEVGYNDYALPDQMADTYSHAVGEEPLRLLAHVTANDLPWTDIVTADYTMANELLGAIWPIEYPEGVEGWQVSHYKDGRPAAGILSTNGLWWRYVTNESNKSRGRIAAVSKLLLCTDILSRPVVFQRSTNTDPEAAIRTDPACQSCHSSIDPAAATLFGYWWVIQYNPYEMQNYHREREPLGPTLLGVEPAWYGTPITGLVDLGWHVSHDPRFIRCGAQSFAEQLWHRDIGLRDYASIEALRQTFVDADLSPLTLLRAVTDTAEYRAGGFTDDAPDEVRGRERVERLLTPNQLATVVEAETGFGWTAAGFAQLENDVVGYRVLRGGVNGYSATETQQDPGLTWAMVNARLAEAAGFTLVERDLAEGAHTTLQGVALDTPSTDPAFEAELRSLYWRWYAERPDDTWTSSITALWASVEAEEGAHAAWSAVIDAMIRDPRFQAY
ncbi:MAG: DUF1592 domain-containing protein [Pseudomonadota bacterium]|nr:DUF1592 domain-containing protein [Pseudomonadota bacterium]